ncbi:nucleotide-diphospho-sugar transferase [Mycena galopus ATCC 62051]|nr:nucleotide-diphospho-sugar transferase [Mycena galopus ATCC 62051]
MFDTGKPVGVQARNSDNRLVKDVLGWEPRTSLRGMQRTVCWIAAQVETLLDSKDDPQSILRQLQRSTVIRLGASILQFGVLLPITSRGTESPQVCLDHLRKFAASLYSTTWRDTRTGEIKFRVKVYLAVDDDDNFLLEGQKAESVLREAGIWDITRLVCKFPRGHVCSLWRHCATAAWKDGCDYMALFGDDVELLDNGWLRGIHQTFQDLSRKTESPQGFVVHRLHMDIFEGSVIPSAFINQDGDPFLFQLYRRFGSSKMASFRIRNVVGGSNDARYTKEHLKEWTFDVLDGATSRVEQWLASNGHSIGKKLTIDVIVPSFRVQFTPLSRILELESSDTAEVMFIIIVDDPEASSGIADLEAKYSLRPDVRIRVNASNLGASASRNRGMEESAAEYVFFLDDDVVPQSDILIKAEEAIRASPDCAGLVGTTGFPPADTIFKSAVHLAGVTYFWDIATKITDDLPWGVTANLIARRNKDEVRYDVRFPKTGGGEDIDFCIRKRNFFVKEGKRGFQAAPEVTATHPWWYNGNRSYWRFYMWAKGDGALVAMFPELCYLDWSPTSAEILLFTLLSALVSTLFGNFSSFKTSMIGVLAVFAANVGHDLYRHLIREKAVDLRSTLTGTPWVIAVAESALIRMLSEVGRLVGQVERGEWLLAIGQQRFDWFAGRVGNGPRDNERRNSRERLVLWFLSMLTISWLT